MSHVYPSIYKTLTLLTSLVNSHSNVYPTDTFPEDYIETSKRKTLQDCRDAYNWYMSLMTPVRQPSVYVVPTPIPVRVSDVTSKLKVISNEERRKRAATEEDTRFLSSLGVWYDKFYNPPCTVFVLYTDIP